MINLIFRVFKKSIHIYAKDFYDNKLIFIKAKFILKATTKKRIIKE